MSKSVYSHGRVVTTRDMHSLRVSRDPTILMIFLTLNIYKYIRNININIF